MDKKSILIKSVIYRATHRGSQEADKILGGFTQERAIHFGFEELCQFSDLLGHDDALIFEWLQKPYSCPFASFYPLLQKIAVYQPKLRGTL